MSPERSFAVALAGIAGLALAASIGLAAIVGLMTPTLPQMQERHRIEAAIKDMERPRHRDACDVVAKDNEN